MSSLFSLEGALTVNELCSSYIPLDLLCSQLTRPSFTLFQDSPSDRNQGTSCHSPSSIEYVDTSF